MNLKILLPFEIFAAIGNVARIVATTRTGEIGLLPHRLDCVAVLSPGILSFETEGQGVSYIALDVGVLIKAGEEVTISARHAIRGKALSDLHERIKSQFLKIAEHEGELRAVISKMDSTLLAQFRDFSHGR